MSYLPGTKVTLTWAMNLSHVSRTAVVASPAERLTRPYSYTLKRRFRPRHAKPLCQLVYAEWHPIGYFYHLVAWMREWEPEDIVVREVEQTKTPRSEERGA